MFGIVIAMATTQAAVIQHTVKSGETLSMIAQKNHTSIEEIKKRNSIEKISNLKVGTVLTVAMNTQKVKRKKHSLARRNIHIVKKQVHTLDEIKAARTLEIKKKHNLALTTKEKSIVKSKKLHTLSAVKMACATVKIKKSSSVAKKEITKTTNKKLHTLSAIKMARVEKPKKKKIKIAKVVKKNTKIAKLKKSQNYVIQQGDTLFTIARKHGMTVAQLLKVNDIKYKETLVLGKKLKVTKQVHVASKKKNTVKKIAKVTKSKKLHKRIVRKKITNKKLRTALNRHGAPLGKRIKKRERVTVNDIFFKSSQTSTTFFSSSKGGKKAKNIINVAKTKLGRKYVWGAVGQGGTFDCSGFTSYVYRKNGINIPRTSRNQSKFGKYVSRKNLKKGDLIFFDTSKRRKGYVNHVGIYLGNGKFIHASSAKKKVVVSSLSKFYAQRYVGARRPS